MSEAIREIYEMCGGGLELRTAGLADKKKIHISSAYYLFMNLAIKKPIVSVLAFCRRLSGECGTPAPLHANSGLNLCSSRRWSCDRPAPGIPSDPKTGTWKRRQIQAFTYSLCSTQGRIIHRRDWASALGHQPIGGHQVIKIMSLV